MATILELTEGTYLNLDMVRFIAHNTVDDDDELEWRIWFGFPDEDTPMCLDGADGEILAMYLQDHAEHMPCHTLALTPSDNNIVTMTYGQMRDMCLSIVKKVLAEHGVEVRS